MMRTQGFKERPEQARILKAFVIFFGQRSSTLQAPIYEVEAALKLHVKGRVGRNAQRLWFQEGSKERLGPGGYSCWQST